MVEILGGTYGLDVVARKKLAANHSFDVEAWCFATRMEGEVWMKTKHCREGEIVVGCGGELRLVRSMSDEALERVLSIQKEVKRIRG